MKTYVWSEIQKGIWLCILVTALQSCAYSQSTDDKTVCVTKTGKKYHTCSCRYLKYSSVDLKLSDAIKLGYEACLVCKPDEGSTVDEARPQAEDLKPAIKNNEVKKTVVDKKPASSQCTAYTKAGTRCKRTASGTSGKCWQHQ